jgi:hypothetical protein
MTVVVVVVVVAAAAHHNICAPISDPNTTCHTLAHCTYQENINVMKT